MLNGFGVGVLLLRVAFYPPRRCFPGPVSVRCGTVGPRVGFQVSGSVAVGGLTVVRVTGGPCRRGPYGAVPVESGETVPSERVRGSGPIVVG